MWDAELADALRVLADFADNDEGEWTGVEDQATATVIARTANMNHSNRSATVTHTGTNGGSADGYAADLGNISINSGDKTSVWKIVQADEPLRTGEWRVHAHGGGYVHWEHYWCNDDASSKRHQRSYQLYIRNGHARRLSYSAPTTHRCFLLSTTITLRVPTQVWPKRLFRSDWWKSLWRRD